MQKLILLAGLFAIIADTCLCAPFTQPPKKLACVYQSTSDQIGVNPFDIKRDIDTQLCSQIIYSSLKPAPVSLSGYEESKFQAFADLKQSNPALQTFLEVDLSTAGSQIFTPRHLDNFTTSVIKNLDAGNFDGLNIKWAAESNSGRPDIKQDFSSLIETLRDRLGWRQLSLSVSAAQSDIDRSYDISALSNDVDFFYVMSFDVDQSSDDPAEFLNAKKAMERFHVDGVPKEKFLMGIASYGYGAEQAIIPKYEEPDAPLPNVYFDSPETIEDKANFIKTSAYGGVIVKALNLDDFNRMGDDGNYPVIQRIHDIILE